MNYIRVYSFICWLSLKGIFRLNLGDRVIYNGEAYWLVQGVSDPYWNIHRLSDNHRIENVHRDQFRKVRTPAQWLRSFRAVFKFYHGYWARIWLNKLQPMRSWP